MKSDEGRLAELARRAERQRADLAGSLQEMAADVREQRVRWKTAGVAIATVVAAGTAAYKLFGRSSPAAQIGRAASAASILLGLGKAFVRLRKFL